MHFLRKSLTWRCLSYYHRTVAVNFRRIVETREWYNGTYSLVRPANVLQEESWVRDWVSSKEIEHEFKFIKHAYYSSLCNGYVMIGLTHFLIRIRNENLLNMKSQTLILIEGLCCVFLQRQHLLITTMVLGSHYVGSRNWVQFHLVY